MNDYELTVTVNLFGTEYAVSYDPDWIDGWYFSGKVNKHGEYEFFPPETAEADNDKVLESIPSSMNERICIKITEGIAAGENPVVIAKEGQESND